MKLRHLIASFSRLKSVREASQIQKVALLKELLQLVEPRLQQCQPRDLAEIMLACSQLGYGQVEVYHTCLYTFVCNQHHANAQTLANMVYAVAKAPDDSIKQQWGPVLQHQLLPVFTGKLGTAKPQEIANIIWGMATMGQQLPAEQLQQLLPPFIDKLSIEKPQGIANVIWGVATMGQQLPAEQLQQLLAGFIGMLKKATPQGIASVIWGVATMGQQVSSNHLRQLLGALVEKLSNALPQDVAMTMWGLARLQPQPFFPAPLLEAKAKQAIIRMVPDMIPQHLSNIAWACGIWGYGDEQLLLPLINTATEDFFGWKGSRSREVGAKCQGTVQGLANMCWAAAVLNMQQLVGHVEQFAAAISRRWGDTVAEEMRQLYQVHTWLQDLDNNSRGLLGCLSKQQLHQCKEQWQKGIDEVSASAKTSTAHQAVFEAAAELPLFRDPPQLEALTEDRLHSIDVRVVTTAGVEVAIEVDGPQHFRKPDQQPTGTTQWRNRSLAARGYVVVSVPIREWIRLPAAKRVGFLEGKIQQGLAKASGGVVPDVGAAAPAS
jgi:hypothetical protein